MPKSNRNAKGHRGKNPKEKNPDSSAHQPPKMDSVKRPREREDSVNSSSSSGQPSRKIGTPQRSRTSSDDPPKVVRALNAKAKPFEPGDEPSKLQPARPSTSGTSRPSTPIDWTELDEGDDKAEENAGNMETDQDGGEAAPAQGTSGTFESRQGQVPPVDEVQEMVVPDEDDSDTEQLLSMAEDLTQDIWNSYMESGAKSPASYDFDLKQYNAEELKVLAQAIQTLDVKNQKENDNELLKKDDKIIQDALARIKEEGSYYTITDSMWAELTDEGKKRSLPFIYLKKAKLRSIETRTFLQAAEEAHAKKLTYIPSESIKNLSSRVRKILCQEHKPLLQKLKLWRDEKVAENMSKPSAIAGQRSYAKAARKGLLQQKDDDLTLHIHLSLTSKEGMDEQTFKHLKDNITKSNAKYALSDDFKPENIAFSRIYWRQGFGVINCDTEVCWNWMRNQLTNPNYTGGIVCRGWGIWEDDKAFLHFQVPKEFDLGEFNVINLILKMNPSLINDDVQLVAKRPAWGGNIEVFFKANQSIMGHLKGDTIQMTWGRCVTHRGRPQANYRENERMDTTEARPNTPGTLSSNQPHAGEAKGEPEKPKSLLNVVKQHQGNVVVPEKSPKQGKIQSLKERLGARAAPPKLPEKSLDKRYGSPSAQIREKIEKLQKK
jgi:hypothetical protein